MEKNVIVIASIIHEEKNECSFSKSLNYFTTFYFGMHELLISMHAECVDNYYFLLRLQCAIFYVKGTLMFSFPSAECRVNCTLR